METQTRQEIYWDYLSKILDLAENAGTFGPTPAQQAYQDARANLSPQEIERLKQELESQGIKPSELEIKTAHPEEETESRHPNEY